MRSEDSVIPVISSWHQLPQIAVCQRKHLWVKLRALFLMMTWRLAASWHITRKGSVKGMSGLHQHSLPACFLSSLEYTSLTWGCTRRWKRRADKRQAESEWINKSLTCVSHSLDYKSLDLQQHSKSINILGTIPKGSTLQPCQILELDGAYPARISILKRTCLKEVFLQITYARNTDAIQFLCSANNFTR